jgi:hypothetical protein
MEDGESRPVMSGNGFPNGTRVVVTGGRYDGDHGMVVNRAPDLRPGSAWVDLSLSGTHLVPVDRLTRLHDSDEHGTM